MRADLRSFLVSTMEILQSVGPVATPKIEMFSRPSAARSRTRALGVACSFSPTTVKSATGASKMAWSGFAHKMSAANSRLKPWTTAFAPAAETTNERSFCAEDCDKRKISDDAADARA